MYDFFGLLGVCDQQIIGVVVSVVALVESFDEQRLMCGEFVHLEIEHLETDLCVAMTVVVFVGPHRCRC